MPEEQRRGEGKTDNYLLCIMDNLSSRSWGNGHLMVGETRSGAAQIVRRVAANEQVKTLGSDCQTAGAGLSRIEF